MMNTGGEILSVGSKERHLVKLVSRLPDSYRVHGLTMHHLVMKTLGTQKTNPRRETKWNRCQYLLGGQLGQRSHIYF